MFFEFLSNFLSFKVNFFNDLIVLLLIYNFFKFIIFSSLIELLWPTQYFNKKHNIKNKFFRLRIYTEYLTKFFKINNFYCFYFLKVLKNILI